MKYLLLLLLLCGCTNEKEQVYKQKCISACKPYFVANNNNPNNCICDMRYKSVEVGD